MKEELMREVPPITRMIDGKPTVIEHIKPDVARRIEELGILNDRYNEYVQNNNWTSVLKLADEYEARGMKNTALRMRQEAEANGYGFTTTPLKTYPRSRPKTTGDTNKTPRHTDVGAARSGRRSHCARTGTRRIP